jgi:hypothetical protein
MQYDSILWEKHIFSVEIHHQYSDGAIRVQRASKWCRVAMAGRTYQEWTFVDELILQNQHATSNGIVLGNCTCHFPRTQQPDLQHGGILKLIPKRDKHITVLMD